MTDYANSILDYIEQQNGSGRMLAELFADENFSPNWRERQHQQSAEVITIQGGDDE
ncbi:hypothetical protein [Shewanella sp. Scap07]|uniref:hypothetical protein n=1 Tax=Shewanella sp. Scap07 TaxID=2589987 RepID=UPI0015BBA691|nr:hypothetical protein [Shewanella sp. Scap07]